MTTATRTTTGKQSPMAKRAAGTTRRRAGTSKAGYHHGDLRIALLDAAEALLEERGVEGLTLRECARRAGVSHGAPAHHFGDVGGLIAELTLRCFESFGARLAGARAAAPEVPFERLLALGVAYVDFALAQPAHFRLMFRMGRLHPSTRLQQSDQASFNVLLECIKETDLAGGGNGSLLEEKALLAQTMVHGFATLVLENPWFGTGLHADPTRARDVLRRMLRIAQPAFESAARVNAAPVAAKSAQNIRTQNARRRGPR